MKPYEAHQLNFLKVFKPEIKLKLPELRQEAFRQYCDHLSKGKTKKSWYFVSDGLTLTYETMETYIKDNPDEFSHSIKRIAELEGYRYWEDFCEKASQRLAKCECNVLGLIMRNKYGWDKRKEEIQDSDKENIEHQFNGVMNQISQAQKQAQSASKIANNTNNTEDKSY